MAKLYDDGKTTIIERPAVTADVAAPHIVKILDDKVMELVESFGNFPVETKAIDARAWQHMLIYVPKEALEARLAKINQQ
jgi:hypothetical protein